jgi:hypothetical protein
MSIHSRKSNRKTQIFFHRLDLHKLKQFHLFFSFDTAVCDELSFDLNINNNKKPFSQTPRFFFPKFFDQSVWCLKQKRYLKTQLILSISAEVMYKIYILIWQVIATILFIPSIWMFVYLYMTEDGTNVDKEVQLSYEWYHFVVEKVVLLKSIDRLKHVLPFRQRIDFPICIKETLVRQKHFNGVRVSK